MENKVYSQIFNDILGKVLQLSESPSQFGEYLMQQIRELVAARTVVIAVKSETEPIRIFSVLPARRTEWANQSAVVQLAEFTSNFETIQYLDTGNNEENIAVLLKGLEIDKAIAIPLIAANRNIGSILLFGIMDEIGNESVIDLLNRLSGVFALIIRNSHLYQNMEELVASRTHELQNRNDELVEAMQRAEKSEMQARDILQTAMDSFWIIDMNGKFIDVNDITCKTLGYTREEMLTMSIPDIEVIEDVEQTKRQIQKIIETGETRFESKHRCKNGQIIDVEVSVKIQPFQNTMVTFAHDITRRKQAVVELTRSEERFNLAMKASNDGLFDWDLETNDIYYSQAWKKMLGYEDHELANDFSVWENTTEPEDVKKSWELQQKLISKEIDRFVLEFKMKHKDGFWVDILSQAEAIFNDSGKAIRIVGTHTDITKRKRAEEELIIAKEKAEESDKLKSAFLSNMSHEIRTPMNGILGFADLLSEPGLDKEEQQEYIKIIQKGGARMLNIINDIVDISKIESGLMKVDLTDTNINEKIEFIYTFFKPQVEEKGMQLRFKNTLTAKEATIKTDSEKVFSILTNLVKNAIKYCYEGSIEIGYEIVESFDNTETVGRASLRFYVKDTGIGIPKDRQEAIFERFIQADIADKMARQGAGLGLSISKAYVEMLGGRIWVESEEGIGSTFYFTLPYTAEPEVKVVAENTAPADIAETLHTTPLLKILIAEDDETSEMLISIAVKKFIKHVIEAKTGRETVEICRTNPDIDLILMDILMPGMNGYEATRQIRQFNKDVVIIAQTAYGLSGDREKAIEAGCNDYIAKPIKKEELLSLIQKYFKN